MGRDKITPDNHYKKDLQDKSFAFFVIAAEGKIQEPKYFNNLKKNYEVVFKNKKLQVEVLKRPKNQENNSAPEYVKKMVDEFIRDNDFDYDKIEDIKEGDVYCLVIDRDKWEEEDLKALSDSCKANPLLNLMISNPCFELWLILHLSEITEDMQKQLKDATSDKKSKTCKNIWNTDLKHNLNEALKIENLKLAVARAKALDKNPNEDHPTAFMTTKVYQVIEKMGLLDEIQQE